MLSIDARLTLIDALSGFPALTEDENGLLRIAQANAAHLTQPMKPEEGIDAEAAFNEIGFRLDRIKRRIEGSNVTVFNPPRFRVKGPQLATARIVG